MAIKFQEVDDKLRNSPLNKEELSLIDKIEKYIDEKIRNGYSGGEVWIEKQIVDFQYDPIEKKSRYNSLPEVRRKLMSEELERRYVEAGWKISLHLDDGLDGNMSGSDYWKLSGKKKRVCNNCEGSGDVQTSERGRAGTEACPYCNGTGFRK